MPWPEGYRPEPAWPADYLAAVAQPWNSGWVMNYLMPANKYIPNTLGADYWQVTTLDSLGNRIAPLPPMGLPVDWWRVPKEMQPYRDEMPYEPKNFGAWPASKITMSDDLRYVWPGQRRPVPPWGYIKLMMPGTPDVSGIQTPKGKQIPLSHWRVHTRYMSPDEMKVKVVITPLGPRYYFPDDDSDNIGLDYKEFKTVLRARRRQRFQQMLAEEIARTKGKPKPHRDLFS